MFVNIRITKLSLSMSERKLYQTDLSDEQWSKIKPLLPKQDGRGRKPVHTRREMLNAILYLNRTGYQWRMLPYDFPAWQAVTLTR